MKVLLAIPEDPTKGSLMLSCCMFLATDAGPGLVPQTRMAWALVAAILVSCGVMSVSAEP